MKKWLLWTSLGTLIVAVAVHIVTLAAIPKIIMNAVFKRTPVNHLLKGPRTTAESRTVVRPSPDLVYSIVSYDVSKKPVRLTARVPTDAYWSVSCFQDNTDNFFVINDRQVKTNPVQIVLVRRGMPIPDAGNVAVVASPTPKGILLVRHLLVSDDKYPELLAIQKESFLQVGDAPLPNAATPPAKERKD